MRKTPKRKCLASQQMYDKNELIRIVRTPDKTVVIDTTGKVNGRGAYLKLSLENIELASKKNAFKRALEVDIPDSIYTELESLIDGNS
ncbi:MAG: YlxR family protein [Erysipelothrix sp.]|nr:YlxR family protein [Erysipelothrix sp.]